MKGLILISTLFLLTSCGGGGGGGNEAGDNEPTCLGEGATINITISQDQYLNTDPQGEFSTITSSNDDGTLNVSFCNFENSPSVDENNSDNSARALTAEEAHYQSRLQNLMQEITTGETLPAGEDSVNNHSSLATGLAPSPII